MRDPHVVSLHYRLEPDESVRFDNPPPVDWSTEAFDMHLADGHATFTLKDHYAFEAAARSRVEEFLKQWDLLMELDSGQILFRLVFERSEIIDRDPPPPGSAQIVLLGAIVEGHGRVFPPTLTVTRRTYPNPPTDFRVSPLLEDLWSLYDRYRHDRERLLPMAYSCLHVLLWEAGGDLKRAARRYRVSDNVLKTLRQLSSFLGDARTARKLDKGSLRRPPSAEETDWIERVLKALIRRVGQLTARPDANWPTLTMADFPPLPPETLARIRSRGEPGGPNGAPGANKRSR